ncbi:MAG: hypothetical protein KAR42_07865 [candidate division Zixibacteria bacterium]|nr:hypothetical protein [candidate division Zixibacteria bacterium]
MNSNFVGRHRTSFCAVGILFVALLIFSYGCKSENINSQWVNKPITVDGKMEDWADIPVTYYEKEDVGLGVCNDSQNVYILFKFRDPRWLRVIRVSGVSVWIDRSGGKNKEFGIKYNGLPSSIDIEALQSGKGFNRQTENPMPDRMNLFDKLPVELRLYDKESIFKEAIIAEDGTEGPHIECDTSMSFFTYELSFPLPESENRFYGIDTKPGSEISIGFIWADMPSKRPPMDNRGGMQGGGMSGGGKGGGRGGSGGRGSGGMGGNRQMIKKQEIWMKTKLAVGNVTQE